MMNLKRMILLLIAINLVPVYCGGRKSSPAVVREKDFPLW